MLLFLALVLILLARVLLQFFKGFSPFSFSSVTAYFQLLQQTSVVIQSTMLNIAFTENVISFVIIISSSKLGESREGFLLS